MAATATNGIAYVYLRSECGRTIFSPSSQSPKNNDEAAGGESTNGEIWYYAELPTLMRNLNIKQIYTFYKPDGSRKFVTHLAWDVDTVRNHHSSSAKEMANGSGTGWRGLTYLLQRHEHGLHPHRLPWPWPSQARGTAQRSHPSIVVQANRAILPSNKLVLIQPAI